MDEIRHLSRRERRSRRLRSVEEIVPLDSWTVSPVYLRDLYGQDVADTYERLRAEQMKEDLAVSSLGRTALTEEPTGAKQSSSPRTEDE